MSKRKNVMVLVLVFLLVAASVSAVAVGNRYAVERQDVQERQVFTRQAQMLQTQQRLMDNVDCECEGLEDCENIENRTETQELRQARQLLNRSTSQQKSANVGGNGPAWAK
jgi:Na+-transporting NADH:ubiquinone oxidoreductase subunit NqrC